MYTDSEIHTAGHSMCTDRAHVTTESFTRRYVKMRYNLTIGIHCKHVLLICLPMYATCISIPGLFCGLSRIAQSFRSILLRAAGYLLWRSVDLLGLFVVVTQNSSSSFLTLHWRFFFLSKPVAVLEQSVTACSEQSKNSACLRREPRVMTIIGHCQA